MSPFKTKLKKFAIEKNMGWCDDPKSLKYNKLIKLPSRFRAEKLYRSNNIYDIILVLDFNLNPTVKGKGSAIFIHIANKKYKSTAGCVAINKKDMKKILKKINKNTVVSID